MLKGDSFSCEMKNMNKDMNQTKLLCLERVENCLQQQVSALMEEKKSLPDLSVVMMLYIRLLYKLAH